MKERFNNSFQDEKIESEILFIFKFLISLIVAIFCLIPSIFIHDLRDKIKKPFIDLFYFISEAKITFVLILINIIVFVFIEPSLIKLNLIDSIASLSLKITGVQIVDIFLNMLFIAFLHADLAHIGWNMFSLLLFGRIVEKYLPRKYLGIYFGSHFFGAIIQILLSGPGIGASAAISGLIFTSILIRPFYLSFAALIPLPVFVLGWISIYGDFTSFIARTNDGVGHLAHIGGYLASFVISIFFVGKENKSNIKKGILINIIGLTIFLLLWFFVLKNIFS